MSWQAECWRDLDRMGSQLAEDFRATRERGRVPAPRRLLGWAVVVGGAALAGEPVAALPGIAVFEAVVAPRLARRPPPTLGPLAEWRPPESWQPSPESPAPLPPGASRRA